jgi:hypothetical protein
VSRTCSIPDKTRANPQRFRTRRGCEYNRNNPGGRPIRYSSRQSQSGDWAGYNSVAPGTDRCLGTWRLVHSVERMGTGRNTDHLRRRQGVCKVSTTQVRVQPQRQGSGCRTLPKCPLLFPHPEPFWGSGSEPDIAYHPGSAATDGDYVDEIWLAS